MLGNSVSYFLSNYWRNAPLYAEKLIPLLDTCLSSNYSMSDKVAKAFYELINKYQNTAELPLQNLKEFIREQGYGYVLDLVSQDESSVKALWYLLVLIAHLKGSKEGILLVLSLFDDNFDPSKTKIEQWYETLPVGKENTFTIESAIDISKLGDNFFERFKIFISNYVYPELEALKINYEVNGRITYRPFSRAHIKYSAQCSFGDNYNGGPAKEMNRDVYDGGPAEDVERDIITYVQEELQLIGDLSDLSTFNKFQYDANTKTYIKEQLTAIDPILGNYMLIRKKGTETIDGILYTNVIAEKPADGKWYR